MMYIEIDNDLLEKVEKITGTDYEPVETESTHIDKSGKIITKVTKHILYNGIINMIEDLVYEHHNLIERISDLKKDIAENYEPKKFNPYDEYGLNENDFH